VSLTTKIPYSTVNKQARLIGYALEKPTQRKIAMVDPSGFILREFASRKKRGASGSKIDHRF
jgi:hypothetical protein